MSINDPINESPTPESQQPDETTAAPPAPSPIRLRVGNREFDLAPEQADLAAAYEARERELNRKLSEQGRELEGWRRQPQQHQPPAQHQPQTPQPGRYDQRIFEDPTKTLEEIRNEAAVLAINAIRQEQAQTRANEQFWTKFYDKHSDLKGLDPLVDSLAIGEQFKGRHRDDVADELADLARTKVLEMTRRTRENGPSPGRPRTTVESGSGERLPAPPAPAEKIMSLTEIMQADRAARDARRRAP